MKPIDNFAQVQAIEGRGGGRLREGTYVIRIESAKEDQTGYGNDCLRLVYDVAEGESAGIFAQYAGQLDMDWRHTVEVDTQEGNGGRLRNLVDALAASNPGWQWNWDERTMAGLVVGVTLQKRLTTNKRGKRKGQTSSYLDLWCFLPVEAVRAGRFEVPPVNDQRDPDAVAAQQQASVPVAVPQSYQPAAPAVPAQGQPYQQPAVPQQFAPQSQGQPVAVPAQPQGNPVQQVAVPQAYAPQPYQQPATYSEDIPF